MPGACILFGNVLANKTVIIILIIVLSSAILKNIAAVSSAHSPDQSRGILKPDWLDRNGRDPLYVSFWNSVYVLCITKAKTEKVKKILQFTKLKIIVFTGFTGEWLIRSSKAARCKITGYLGI